MTKEEDSPSRMTDEERRERLLAAIRQHAKNERPKKTSKRGGK